MAKFANKTEPKKEVTKAAAVKSVVKNPAETGKQGSNKFLQKVPETMVFWCHDGQIFDDLERLMMGFDLMSDETFLYHANEDKNDFSCWIIDVIGDGELAKDIKKAKNKAEAKKVVQRRHKDLNNFSS